MASDTSKHNKFVCVCRWDYYEDRGKLVQEMEGHSAFETAIKSWGRWIDQTVNATKTSVFFRSISPDHREYVSDHKEYLSV